MKINRKEKIVVVSLAILVVATFLSISIFKPSAFKDFFSSIRSFLVGKSSRDRIEYNFNYGWTFSKGEGKLNAGSTLNSKGYPVTDVVVIPNETDQTLDINKPYSLNYDASSLGTTWKEVSLPHTYNDEDTFNTYTEKGLIGERTMYTGTAWYKKTFFVPEYVDENNNPISKRVIIEFEAARQAAKVYVNGELQNGTYENGFIAFGYDITDSINFGADNEITVMVDNSYPYYMEGTASAVSWHDSHWHPNYGGLYRNSFLYIVDDLHLTLPLYSFTEGEGTYVYTSNETISTATINVSAEVENSGTTGSREFTYKALVKNAGNQTVLELNGDAPVTLAAGQKTKVELTGVLNNPVYWSTNYPYLYTLEMEIYENGILIDSNSNTFGVRTFRMTSDYGFYLNENYIELNGWGQKSTNEWAAIGAAYPNWMQDYTIKLMKDAGANYLRWGHTAGSKTQTNITDKYGILVTQPGVDGEGNDGPYDSNTYKLRVEALRDMIIEFRNHPSIIVWEIGNKSGGLNTVVPNDNYITEDLSWLDYNMALYPTHNYASVLKAVVEQYDYGNRDSENKNAGTYDNTNNKESSNRFIAVRSFENYMDSIVDIVETTQASGNKGNKPAVEGEYNRYEVRREVWDYSTPGYEDFLNTTSDHGYSNVTNEEFAKYQVTYHTSVVNYTSYVGGANWIFSDSISHGRVQSEVARASGEVDASMIPKVAYFVDKTLFSTDPSVYIIGHWNYPVGTTKDIYVVANKASKVELFINGVSQGYGTVSSNNLYTFNDIVYEQGTITAKSYDIRNEEIASYSISSHKSPDHLVITPITGVDGAYANGSDIVLFDVELVDEDGNRCITYDGQLQDTIVNYTYTNSDAQGLTAEWLGGYNSNIAENTRSTNLYLESGLSRVALRTTMNPGPISVTATMGTYTATSSTFNTQSVVNDRGLSTFVDETPVYSLNSSLNLGVGNGLKPGEAMDIKDVSSSLYIENLFYTGTELAGNGIYDALNEGDTLYSDSAITISDMPYEFLNAEIIKLPNADRGNTAATDLITFNVVEDVDVYVLHDSNVLVPTWLTNTFTIVPGKTIESSNGTIYNVYMVRVPKNTAISIGGNSDDGTSGLNGYNQVIVVKDTANVTSRTFFYQDFEDFTTSAIVNGWGGKIPLNTSISKDTVGGRNALRFVDTGSNIAYTIKKFAKLNSKYSVEYKIYIPKDDNNNTWLRFWLSDGIPTAYDDKTKLAIETYVNKTSTSFNIKAIDQYAESQTLGSGYSLDTWHTIRYEVDPINYTYDFYVDGVLGNSNYSSNMVFSRSTYQNTSGGTPLTLPIESPNSIMFGTGVLDLYTANYYIDDVTVEPVMDIGASAIVVNGYTIDLSDNLDSYVILDSNIPASSTYEIIQSRDYLSHSISYTAHSAIVSITNQTGEIKTIEIIFDTTDLLADYQIHKTNNTSTNYAETAMKDNEKVIHLFDSDASMLYIEKQFTPISTSLEYSFDVFLTGTYDNKFIRTFVTKGPMGTRYDVSNNSSNGNILGVHAFLHQTQTSPKIESFQFISTTTEALTSPVITLNEWHNIKYVADVINQNYYVYLDNNLVKAEATAFYKPQSELSNIVIGTGGNGTTSMYIKNVNVQELTKPPLESISIDGLLVPEFINTNSEYTFYSDGQLSDNTDVAITYNDYYVSHTVVKDIEHQRFVINVVNNLNETITYTITYASALTRPISAAELQALIDEAEELVSTDYTPTTWEILVGPDGTSGVLGNAKSAVNNPNSITQEYSIAYFELESAINGLLHYLPFDDGYSVQITETATNNITIVANYTEYQASLVNTIYYSNNLENVFSFEKVLENGSKVYNDSDTNIFTSVPFKYMNAEYLVMNNSIYANASIRFTALQDIDILIFRDWDAGPFTDSDYEYTGEIATANDGTVYKIYKKIIPYTKDSIIDLDINDMVNNIITRKNGIVAFIKSTNANNNNFFNENISTYTNDVFTKSWLNIVSNLKGQQSFANSSTIITADALTPNDLYIYQETTSTTTIPIVQKRFAHLYEIFEFRFTARTTEINGIENKWIRAWITSSQGAITGTDADKDKPLVDFYLGDQTMLYCTDPTTWKNKALGNSSYIDPGLWYDYWFTIDIINQEWTLKYKKESDNSWIDVTPSGHNIFFVPASGDPKTSANHVYFSGRGSNHSKSSIKNISVTPILSGMYSDILVGEGAGAVSLGNYHDLTKAYLKVLDTPTSSREVTTSAGTLTPTENITYEANNKYADISAVDTDYLRNYRIYYEVDDDSSKDSLTDLLTYALSLRSTSYTVASYNNLLAEIEDTTEVLANHEIVSNNVTIAETELQAALDNLVGINDFNLHYTAKGKADHQYNGFEASSIDITNDSSFTSNFIIETRSSSDTYRYESDPHARFLKTDMVLPQDTKIVMSEEKDGEVKRYYYIVTANDVTNNKTRYAFSDFILSGTVNKYFVNSYNFNSSTRIINESFSFIIDFIDCQTKLSDGNHTLELELYIDDVLKSTSDVITYQIYSEETPLHLQASFAHEYYYPNDIMNLNITLEVGDILVDGIPVSDTTLFGKKSGLILSLVDPRNNIVSFPKGTVITDGDYTYAVDNDGMIRLSRGVSVESLVRSISIRMGEALLGNYKIRVGYLESYDGINLGTINVTEDVNMTVADTPDCSINAAVTDNTNVINLNTSTDIVVNIHTICKDITASETITASLYKKNDSIFSNHDYTLIDLNAYTNNNLAYHSEGVYTIETYENEEQSIVENITTLHTTINNTIPAGSYKLIYDIRAGAVIKSDEVTFVVK